jgi:hypothetical protein
MPNELPLPRELEKLIEKREPAARRRKGRRAARDRRAGDMGPLGALESSCDLANVPLEDRRSARDRRKSPRRKASRRR